MKFRSKLSLAVAAAACWTLPATVTHAQSGADLALEEIVVSARKRDESLQEVPIAVDVFTEVQLKQLAIDNVESLARYTPSLTYDEGVLPMDTRPVIRGANALRGRPNTGILVDFVDVSSESLTVAGGGITSNLALLDLERVEVVKGPQSALYGRSAFTGAINYITKRPGEEFEGEISVGYDEHESTEVGFRLSGPLGDKFGGSVSFKKVDEEGFYRNPNTGQFLGSSESTGGSLALTWDLSERTSMYLRGEQSTYKAAPRAEVLIQSISPLFNPALNPFGTGSMTDDAIGVPHLFPETCNGVDRDAPNNDSFFVFDPVLGAMVPAGPFCRGLVVGEIHATESDIDISADPRTGRDFLGSDVDNTRIHFDLKMDFEYAEFMYVMGYTDNQAHVQEDFDKTSVPILSIPGVFSQYGLSAMSEQRIDTTQWNHEFRLSGGGDRVTWMLSALHWNEEMSSQFDDEWWLREGGSAAEVLAIFNSPFGPFGYLNTPIVPGVIDNFCDLIYPGVPGCIPAVTTIATGPGDTPFIPLHRRTKHNSIAGMASIMLTDDFVVSLEGRLLDEVIDYSGGAADVGFYSQFGQDPWWGWMFGPGEMTYNTIDEDAFVPKITLDWAVSDNMLLYGYYSQAFKPGGISTTDANGDVRTGEYKSEQLEAWEIGIKSDFRDRSIRFNAAAFFYDYTDQQVPYQFMDPNTGLLQTTVINAGSTDIKGAEMDLIWNSAFFEGMSARLSYTFTDAEFTSFNLAEILAQAGGTPSAFNRSRAGNNDADFTGKVPPMTPENLATLSLRYDGNFGSNMSTYVELVGIYSSERFVSDDNRSWLPQYTEWDLFAGLVHDNWELTLFVENLADDDKIKSGLSNVDYGILPDGRSVPHAIGAYLPQPRTAGMRFQYNFGN